MERPQKGEIYMLTFIYSTLDWQMTSATCLIESLGFDTTDDTNMFKVLEEFRPGDMVETEYWMDEGYVFGVWDVNFPVKVIYKEHTQYIIYTKQDKSRHHELQGNQRSG
jgi:hypothetical protein